MRGHWWVGPALALVLVLLGAGGGLLACERAQTGPEEPLSFAPDVAVGEEAYLCFGFDGARDAGRAIVGVDWTAPAGDVLLHHANLYALAGAYDDGPVPCDGMPAGAVPLHVWLPGSGPLRLPAGVGVAVPADTTRFVIETHVLRLHEGPAGAGRAVISFAAEPPARIAGWTALQVPVPPLPPQRQSSSARRCPVPAPLHLYYAWPHMHLLGKTFEADVLRADGSTTLPLLDVPAWDFNHQLGVAMDLDLATGDSVGVSCTWFNDTNAYVLPGPRTSDEMCQAGFIAWPALAGGFCATE